jgi:hydroxypyruvate isomerase
MNQPTNFSRRQFMNAAAITAAGAALSHRLEAADLVSGLKGRINHSACKWCYASIPLDELCRAGKEMGLTSIDLVDPPDFETLKKHGLTSALVSFPSMKVGGKKIGTINHGFNLPENHETLIQLYEPLIKKTADFGAKNLICFSGDRAGLDDEIGLKNCAEGLKKLMPIAEKHGITLTMELLNSRVNHPDYMCDTSAWGIQLCEAIGSDHFKLLFDIYHMQIMEGDIISTIKKNHRYFSHYHTGGVPGRNEIDDSQELFYPAIMRAIVETGYQGWVAQEFIPAKPDKLASLRQAVDICDV